MSSQSVFDRLLIVTMPQATDRRARSLARGRGPACHRPETAMKAARRVGPTGSAGRVGYAIDRIWLLSPTPATAPRGTRQRPNSPPHNRSYVQDLGPRRPPGRRNSAAAARTRRPVGQRWQGCAGLTKHGGTPGQLLRRRPGVLILRVGCLPAGPKDQRECCGCDRKHRDQTGGLGVTGLDRPSDFLNQSLWPTAPRTNIGFGHCLHHLPSPST